MPERVQRRSAPKGTSELFEYVRLHSRDEVELLHDIHERVQPIDAINLCKEMEQ